MRLRARADSPAAAGHVDPRRLMETPADYAPNADAFFAAFEAVVTVGFFLVLVLVVVLAIRRLVSS